MPNEGAAECDDCEKPHCAKAVASCNVLSGLEQVFAYYDIFEVLSTTCGVPKNVTDTCSAPSHCVAGAAQCGRESPGAPI